MCLSTLGYVYVNSSGLVSREGFGFLGAGGTGPLQKQYPFLTAEPDPFKKRHYFHYVLTICKCVVMYL